MSVATNRGVSGAAGVFATSRRGGVSAFEVEQMRQRLGTRATPAQIAKALGRCEADVRAIMFPQPEEQPAPVKVEPLVFDQPWTDHEIRLLTLMYAEMGMHGRRMLEGFEPHAQRHTRAHPQTRPATPEGRRMNAIVQFPERAGRDLTKDTAVGISAIDRKVNRIIEDHEPHGQAARLVIRFAVLAGRTRMSKAELVNALRDLTDEIEGTAA